MNIDKQWYRAMQKAEEAVRNDPHLAAVRRQAEEMEAAGLSTDGPTPPPCDPELFAHGIGVFATSTIAPNAMEGWVKQVRQHSGQRVDWHMAGGRNTVVAIGDIEAVKTAILELMPEHDRLYAEALKQLGH